MREFLKDLATTLGQVAPSFLHLPPKTNYPYITIELEQNLQGLPWGPRIVILTIKIWSRYAGTQEILKLAKGVENLLEGYTPQDFKVSLKILEGTLKLLTDGQTRVYTCRLKARLTGAPS